MALAPEWKDLLVNLGAAVAGYLAALFQRLLGRKEK